ncbi:hypothetical protein Tco_0984480 [Tanacetum coccineum]
MGKTRGFSKLKGDNDDSRAQQQDRKDKFIKSKDVVGFTPRREEEFRIELVQGATLIYEGSNRLNAFREAKVVGIIKRVARYDILKRPEVLEGTSRSFKMIVGVREGREEVREVFQQRGAVAKRKLFRCGRIKGGNEPILHVAEGADDFVVYSDAQSN